MHKIALGSRLPFPDKCKASHTSFAIGLSYRMNDSAAVFCGRYWELRRPPRHGLDSVVAAMAGHIDEATGVPHLKHSWWPRNNGGGDDVQEDVYSKGMQMSAVSEHLYLLVRVVGRDCCFSNFTWEIVNQSRRTSWSRLVVAKFLPAICAQIKSCFFRYPLCPDGGWVLLRKDPIQLD